MGNNETWMQIHGYEDIYEVADMGIVRSVDRTIILASGIRRKRAGKILASKRNRDGYLFVTLSINGRGKTHYIHRLVARAFIPNPDPDNLLEVNHRSGDKTDNTPSNLQWVNHRQNVQHAYDNDLTSNKGGSHCFAVGVVDNILGKKFATIKEWCAARKINYSTGRNMLTGHNVSKTIDLSAIVKQSKSKHND